MDHLQQGEWAELLFMAEARSRGFIVAKVMGQRSPFDLILVKDGRLWRVQVKSVSSARKEGHRYRVSTATARFSNGHRGFRPYTQDEVDVIVAYIIPHNLWYILPTSVIKGRSCVYVGPHRCDKGRYEHCRDAWHLLG
jgi:hypothetical protein